MAARDKQKPRVDVAPRVGEYRERVARSSAQWTPTQIRAAYHAAEAGSLLRLADLVDASLEDDRVAGTIATRTRGLLRLPIKFEGGQVDGQDPTPEQQAVADALKADFWRAMPEAQLAQLMTWGILLGVGLAELEWTTRGDRIIPKLRIWHPRWLRWDQGSDRWFLHTENAGEIPIEPEGDPRWFLYFPYGQQRPWRQAAIRAIAPMWLLKRYAIQDWGTYNEAHGNPIRVTTAPEGSNAADRKLIAEDLNDISGRAAMALPAGFDIKLLEATARTWETFREQKAAADAGIAITVLGQTLTTEVTGASLAAAQVHDLVRGDIIESDDQVLETSLHDGPIGWWAAFNFGLSEADAPWASWDTTPDKQREIFSYHLGAGVITVNELRAYLGLEPFQGPEGDQLIRIGEPGAGEPGSSESTAQPLSRLSGPVRLASGDRAPAGYVRGQLYTSGLAQRMDGLQPLRSSLEKLTKVISEAQSFAELEEALPGVLEDMDPDDVAPLMEALMLADLAGQKAASDDL